METVFRGFAVRIAGAGLLSAFLLAFALLGCGRKVAVAAFDLQYYKKIPHIVGVTDDVPNYTFFLRVSVGYRVRNVRVLRYLSALRSKIADDIRFLFSLKSCAYLDNPRNEAVLKAEIKDLINRRIAERDPNPLNRVVDVLFEEFDIYDYQD